MTVKKAPLPESVDVQDCNLLLQEIRHFAVSPLLAFSGIFRWFYNTASGLMAVATFKMAFGVFFGQNRNTDTSVVLHTKESNSFQKPPSTSYIPSLLHH